MIVLPILDLSPSHRAVEIGPSLGPCCHRMMWTFDVEFLFLRSWNGPAKSPPIEVF